MQERVKIFTFVTGHGETLLEPRHEELINQWLDTVKGRLTRVTQSESESPRVNAGHHITICIWYVPDESA